MKNYIQHIIATIALALMLSYSATAQITAQKIGKNPTTIAASAVLDIESDTKGVLFPRVALNSTTDGTAPVAAPAVGLVIYNTATAGIAPNNVIPGYYFWNGSKWTRFSDGQQASKWINDATNASVYLNNLSDGFTARTPEKRFNIHDNNVLQIGDITNVSNPSISERSVLTRKNGSNSVLNISDGGVYSSVSNEIYGGAAGSSAAYFTMTKYRGSLASPQVVQNGDLVGVLDFRGGTGVGANFVNGARLITSVEGTVNTALSPASIPMAFNFQTTGTGETSPSTRLKIASNGNVGIGTSTPTSLLHLVASVTPRMLVETTDGSAGQASVDLKAGTSQWWRIIGQGSANASRFDIWNQTLNTNAFSILPNNNVGIGTTNPTSRLANNSVQVIGSNVQSSSSPTGFTWHNTNAGFGAAFWSEYQGVNVKVKNTSSIAFEVGSGTTPLNDNVSASGSTPLFKVLTNGNIGIGTTAPSAQLHTTGTVRFAGAGTPGVNKVLTSDANGNATWQQPVANVSFKTANYTLSTADQGTVIVVTSAVGVNVTLTLPSNLPAGFFCQVIQAGVGQVQFVGAGVTVNSAMGKNSRMQGSSVGILFTSATEAYLSGDTSL